MKKNFFMDCQTAVDTLSLSETDSSFSILAWLRAELHLLFCSDCADEQKNLRDMEEFMKTDFFPPSPGFEKSVMERVYMEPDPEENFDFSAGFSFRGWVLIGFFLLLSLSSSFFGITFIEIANEEGSSFLLPVGITIGTFLTCYGALFIGSHLEELSMRFRLH